MAVGFVCVVFLLIRSVVSDCNEEGWQREQMLDSNKIVIRWKYDQQNLTMMMMGESTGWIGIGFSPSGTMAGADLVLGWIKDGKPYLQDRYATRNGRPLIDDVQSYHLIGGTENSTHTTICWTRKLNTCDKQDYKITNDTVRVIYAFNAQDPKDDSLEAPLYHGFNRGLKFVHLFNLAIKKPSLQDMKTMDIATPNLTLPNSTDTLYWCSMTKIPKMDVKRYIIGYEPRYQKGSEHLIHHWAFYECSSKGFEELLDSIPQEGYNCQDNSKLPYYSRCHTIQVTATVGNEGSFFPPDVGFELGSTVKDTYYLFEIHYNIKPQHYGIVESSGFRIYYTTKPMKHESGLFNVGIDFFQYQIVPPRQQAFSGFGICPQKCMQEVFPAEGVRVFSVFFHAHYTTRKVRLHRYRNGVELEPIVDDFFNADFQELVNLKDEIVILPNDTLVAECVYDTTKRISATLVRNSLIGFGIPKPVKFALNSNNALTKVLNLLHENGPSALDEMCLVFLLHYPRVNLGWCQSSLRLEDLQNITGIEDMWRNTTIIKEPAKIANQSIADYWKTLNWTEERVKALENLYLNGNHQASCRLFDGLAHNTKNDLVQIPRNVSAFIPPEDDNCNS